VTRRAAPVLAGCGFVALVAAAAIPRTLLDERPAAAPAVAVLALLSVLALASAMLALDGLRRLRSLAGTFVVTIVVVGPVVLSGVQPKLPLVGQLWREREPARHLLTVLGILVVWQLLLMFTRELRCRAEHRAIEDIEARFPLDGRSMDWTELVSGADRDSLARARVALVVEERSKPGGVADVVLERADRDAAASQSDYGPLRALVWALPAIGFIGTAATMSQSISGIGSAVDAGSGSQAQQRALIEVIPNLGDAFNITLVALASTVFCFLLLAIVGAREERMLNDVQALAMRAVARVEVGWPPTPGIDGMDRLITELWSLQKELARLRGPIEFFAGGKGSASTISSLLYATAAEMRELNKRAEKQAEAMQSLTTAIAKVGRRGKVPS
jgi:hypothetical protein